MPVTEDIIPGTRCFIGKDGKTYRRVVKVEGLDRTPASSLHYRAVRVAASAGALYGAAHPHIPGLIVESIDTEPVHNSKTAVYVNITYFDASVIIVRVNGNVVRETTRYDVDGEVLSTRYMPAQKPNFLAEKNQRGSFEQPVEAPVLRPGLTIEYEWWDTKVGTINPRAVTGKINSEDWNGGPAHTWLCTDCSPQWTIGAGMKEVKHFRAGFEYRGFQAGGAARNTHDILMVYRNPQTRMIPAEIDPIAGDYPTKKDGNGWKEAQLNEDFDFNRLKLPTVIPN